MVNSEDLPLVACAPTPLFGNLCDALGASIADFESTTYAIIVYRRSSTFQSELVHPDIQGSSSNPVVF